MTDNTSSHQVSWLTEHIIRAYNEMRSRQVDPVKVIWAQDGSCKQQGNALCIQMRL